MVVAFMAAAFMAAVAVDGNRVQAKSVNIRVREDPGPARRLAQGFAILSGMLE